MITVEDILQKAQRSYGAFLQSWIRGEPYTPLTFPVGKLPTDFVPLRAVVQQLQAHSKVVLGYGYSIEWQQQQKRSLKTQTLPARIVLETATDFLCLIEKEREFLHFQQDVTLIREQVPQLEAWMVRFPRKVIEYHGDWLSLLIVCRYFFGTSQAGSLYSRTASQCPHKIRGRAYGYPARVTGADPSCGGNWARCSHLSAAFWLARGGVTHPCTLSGSSTGKELRHPTERIVRAPFTIRSPGLADTALHNY